MKLQKQRSGMKDKYGNNYIAGYYALFTKEELKLAGIDADEEVTKSISKGKLIIEQKKESQAT